MKRGLAGAYTILVLVFIGGFVIAHRAALGQYLESVQPVFLLPATVAGLCFFAASGLLWALLQRRLQDAGRGLSVLEWLRIFMIGYLGRYIPGKVAMLISRVYHLKHFGFSRGAVVAGSLYELLLSGVGALLAAGVSLLLVPLPAFPLQPLLPLFLVVAALTLLAVTVSPLFPRLFAAMSGGAAGYARIQPLAVKKAIVFLSLYILLALGGGAVFLLFANTLTPMPLTAAGLLLATAIVNLAGITGMLAVFAPAGLGVREGVIVLFLTSATGSGPNLAVLVAISYRLFLTAVEVLFFFLVSTIAVVRKRHARA